MNEYIETLKSIYENKEKLALKEQSQIDAKVQARKNFVDKYYKIKESRELSEREYRELLKECRNEMFATALKAIYITALDEQSFLTEEEVELAESMVDKYIKEHGDASAIMAKCKNKTYLLSELCRIVEDAAEDEAKNIVNISDETLDADDNTEAKEAEPSKDETLNNAVKDAAEALVKKLEDLGYEVKKKEPTPEASTDDLDKAADTSTTDDLDTADDTKADASDDAELDLDAASKDGVNDDKEAELDAEADLKSDDNDDDTDLDADTEDLDTDDLDSDDEDTDDSDLDAALKDEDDEEIEDDSEAESDAKDIEDAAKTIDKDLDVEEELPSINKDAKQNLFDELEKSKEVADAIETIRSRVADAEQALIKKNAEDKKKVNNLLNKIADNVKTIEDIAGKKYTKDSSDNNDSPEVSIAKESMMMAKRRINEISNNRPTTVLEKMTRIVMGDVVKKESLKNRYLNENGSLDTESLVESVKIMYAFLETVNTLQLEKVDEVYIKNVLTSMR